MRPQWGTPFLECPCSAQQVSSPFPPSCSDLGLLLLLHCPAGHVPLLLCSACSCGFERCSADELRFERQASLMEGTAAVQQARL